MASSDHMVSTILPEKSSGSLAFISVGLVVVPSMLFKGCWAGAKCSSLVILIVGVRDGSCGWFRESGNGNGKRF